MEPAPSHLSRPMLQWNVFGRCTVIHASQSLPKCIVSHSSGQTVQGDACIFILILHINKITIIDFINFKIKIKYANI